MTDKWDDYKSRNRGGGHDDAVERLFDLQKGRRQGQSGSGGGRTGSGKPNLGRGRDGHPTRATHINVRPIFGAKLPAYILREGKNREDDLEAFGGLSADEMAARILRLEAEIDADERIPRNGRGHKPAAAFELGFDLPLDSTPETRRLSVERIALLFQERNFEVTWAIHAKVGHPHAHILILAGERGRRPVDGSGAMIRIRTTVAAIINRTHVQMTGTRLDVEFSGETLRSLGVDRPPKPDIPTALYRARERRDARRGVVGQASISLAAAADRIEDAWKADVASFEAGHTIMPRSKKGLQSSAAQSVAAWGEKAAREIPAVTIAVPVAPPRVEITIDVETPGGVLRRSTIEKRVVDAKSAWELGRDAGVRAGEIALAEERRRAEAALVAAKAASRAADEIGRERPHTRMEVDHLLLQERRKALKDARKRHDRMLAEEGVVSAQRAQAELAAETTRRLAAEAKADRLERQLATIIRGQQTAPPPAGGTSSPPLASGPVGARPPGPPKLSEADLPVADGGSGLPASPAAHPPVLPESAVPLTSDHRQVDLAPVPREYPSMPPLRADGGEHDEVAAARELIRGYSNDQLIGAIFATRRARDELNNRDTAMGRYERKRLVVGLTLAYREVDRRGIDIPPEGKPYGQLGRGNKDDLER